MESGRLEKEASCSASHDLGTLIEDKPQPSGACIERRSSAEQSTSWSELAAVLHTNIRSEANNINNCQPFEKESNNCGESGNVENVGLLRLPSNEDTERIHNQSGEKVVFLNDRDLLQYIDFHSSLASVVPAHSVYEFVNTKVLCSDIVDCFLNSFGPRIKTLILQEKAIREKRLYQILEKSPRLESLRLGSILNLRTDISAAKVLAGEEVRTSGTKLFQLKPRRRELESEYPKFPQIRHLTICGTQDVLVYASEEEDPFIWIGKSRPWVRLLSSFPNLLSISVDTQRPDPELHAAILRCLIDADSAALQNLATVNFKVHLQTQALAKGLLDLQLRSLTQLDLVVGRAVESKTVTELLSAIGNSLTSLSLAIEPGRPDSKMPIRGHHLPCLRNLSLVRYEWSLWFLGRLPALESLTLTDMDLDDIFPYYFGTPHRRLRTLKVFNNGDNEQLANNPDLVLRIWESFPCLKVFEFFGANDVFVNDIKNLVDSILSSKRIRKLVTIYGISKPRITESVIEQIRNEIAHGVMDYLVIPDSGNSFNNTEEDSGEPSSTADSDWDSPSEDKEELQDHVPPPVEDPQPPVPLYNQIMDTIIEWRIEFLRKSLELLAQHLNDPNFLPPPFP